MRLAITLLFVSVIGSCASSPERTTRSPASAPVQGACGELLNDLVDLGPSLPNAYRLRDFPELEVDWIEARPRLKSLVELHGLEENQEQAQIILSLIRRNSPEASADSIARRYAALFRECE